MSLRSPQARNGKAFEYALLLEFKEKLERLVNVEVIKNSSLEIARSCYDSFNEEEQGLYRISSSFAINFLMDLEPRLCFEKNDKDILQLEILSDAHGKSGDVRDVIAIRLLQEWEIGISAKNNHDAVKYSRLSKVADFGKTWLGIDCSEEYFADIAPVFDSLKKLRKESNATATWSDHADKESVYVDILEAFSKELNRLSASDGVAEKLVKYLVGRKDYYKVIKTRNNIEIKAFKLSGTLNREAGKRKSKLFVPVLQMPTRIVETRLENSSRSKMRNTVIVELDNDWVFSMRIHSASSRIEASLKFDVSLLKAPSSLFSVNLSTNKKLA